jgi:hypothetical protein
MQHAQHEHELSAEYPIHMYTLSYQPCRRPKYTPPNSQAATELSTSSMWAAKVQSGAQARPSDHALRKRPPAGRPSCCAAGTRTGNPSRPPAAAAAPERGVGSEGGPRRRSDQRCGGLAGGQGHRAMASCDCGCGCGADLNPQSLTRVVDLLLLYLPPATGALVAKSGARTATANNNSSSCFFHRLLAG